MLHNFINKIFTVKIIIAVLLFALGFFPLVKINAQSETHRPGIYYAITGKGLTDTSWLFGTYHLVNSDFLKSTPALRRSFDKAKGVIVEVETDSASQQKVQAMGLMQDKTLISLLDKAFSDSLNKELQQTIGASLEQVKQLKPVNIMLTLSLVQLIKNNKQQLEKYTGLPLDVWFATKGRQTNKSIFTLETIEEQMNLLFNKDSDEEQVKQLKQFFKTKAEMTKLGDEMLKGWFEQDLGKLLTIYEQTLQLSGEADFLVKDRNMNWMKKLPGLLAKESQFIAVGALHLAGPYGLVSQLQELGYTVTPIKP